MSVILAAHSDLDGLGCIIIADCFNVQYDHIKICDYGDFKLDVNRKELFKYDEILVTDFSLPTELVEGLLHEGKKVTILDHHDYSENAEVVGLLDLKHENFTLVHDMTICGTMICFEYFKKNTRVKKIVYEFAELVNCYDLYKTKDPLWEKAQGLNRIIWACLSWGNEGIDKYTFIRDYWAHKIKHNNEWFWSEFEEAKIKKAIEIENTEFIAAKATYKEYKDSKDVTYGIAVASKKISIIASRLLEEKKDIKYIIMINSYGKTWEKLSLRSLSEDIFDCTKIADGHKCACGMEVDPKFAMDLYKGLIKLEYKDEKVSTKATL